MVKGFLCFVRELLKRPFRHTSIRTLYEHFSMLGAYWGPNRRSAVYLKYELYWPKASDRSHSNGAVWGRSNDSREALKFYFAGSAMCFLGGELLLPITDGDVLFLRAPESM